MEQFIALIEVSKAFDSLNRGKLIKILKKVKIVNYEDEMLLRLVLRKPEYNLGKKEDGILVSKGCP